MSVISHHSATLSINLKTISMSSWILQRFLKHNSLSDLLRLILTLTKKSFFRNTDVILHCIEGFVEVWAKGVSTFIMPFMSSLIPSLLLTYRERTAAKVWKIHMYVYFSNKSASETWQAIKSVNMFSLTWESLRKIYGHFTSTQSTHQTSINAD